MIEFDNNSVYIQNISVKEFWIKIIAEEVTNGKLF